MVTLVLLDLEAVSNTDSDDKQKDRRDIHKCDDMLNITFQMPTPAVK